MAIAEIDVIGVVPGSGRRLVAWSCRAHCEEYARSLVGAWGLPGVAITLHDAADQSATCDVCAFGPLGG